MRKRIIDWFFTLQSQRGILGEKERRFYTYAYGLLLNKIAIYAIIAIVGTTTGNWIEMFSFLLPFTVLRQYAGGIHLEKPTSCIIFSGFLVFGCGQYLAVTSDIGFSFFFLWLIAVKKFVDDYACNHKICVSKQNIDVTDSNYCSYCSSWVQRAIIYNGEQVEKWIDNCREFEKALDRSEVFRSVL